MSAVAIVSGTLVAGLAYATLAAYMLGRAGRRCRGVCGYNSSGHYPCGDNARCFWHAVSSVVIPLHAARWIWVLCYWVFRLPARAVAWPMSKAARLVAWAHKRGEVGPPKPPDPSTMPRAPREALHVEEPYR